MPRTQTQSSWINPCRVSSRREEDPGSLNNGQGWYYSKMSSLRRSSFIRSTQICYSTVECPMSLRRSERSRCGSRSFTQTRGRLNILARPSITQSSRCISWRCSESSSRSCAQSSVRKLSSSCKMTKKCSCSKSKQDQASWANLQLRIHTRL
jgi:hypothetical protein